MYKPRKPRFTMNVLLPPPTSNTVAPLANRVPFHRHPLGHVDSFRAGGSAGRCGRRDRALKRDEYTLDLSRIRRGEEGVWKERSEAGKLVKFGFPKFVAADAFYYTIYIDHLRREFWIRRGGGIAPENEISGPDRLRRAGMS